MRGGYNPSYFERVSLVEERHFWFRARNRAITTLVKQITAGQQRSTRILELGCGTGGILRTLEKVCPESTIVGFDLFAEALKYARQRTSCHLVQGDVNALPLRAKFDVICLLDVLEHLPNDEEVLRSVSEFLVPGGTLLLTVPAHQSLWSYFDEASRHCRRYESGDLSGKLHRAGYHIDYLTHFMATIFPLVWLTRRFAPLIFRSSTCGSSPENTMTIRELTIVFLVNDLLGLLLTQEARLIARRCILPIGTSLLAMCHRGAPRES